jgi:hypothetical protein
MTKMLEEPSPPPRRGIPCELKLSYNLGGWIPIMKGYMYTIREKYGPKAALEIYERSATIDDRVKNLTNAFRTFFNLTETDAIAIGEWFDIWDEFIGIESTILERSKNINRRKVIKCPFKTDPIDISDWALIFTNIVTKTINPKLIFERPKAMCAGDSYCEYIFTLEE